MPTARSGLALASLSSDGKLYAVGGQTGTSTYTGATQAYSPTGNNWATVAADTARTGSVAGGYTLAGTTYLYVAGGYTGTWSGLVSYLNPLTNSWGSVASIPTARGYLGTAVGSDGWVYMIGGQNTSGDLNVVQAFSPTTLDWYCSSSVAGCTKTSTPPIAMPTARSKMAVVTDSNGLIYVIGGETANGVYTNVVEAYNPSTRTWTCSVGDTSPGCSSTTIAPMPTSRDADADTTSDGLIYVIGGNNSTGDLSSIEVFNPSTNSWACSTGDSAGSGCSSKVLTDLPTARVGAAVATGSDGRLYVVGGNNGTYLSTVEAYQPPTVPGAPGSVTATGANASASVTWTAPASTGGMPISGYTVTCTPSCTPVMVPSGTLSTMVSGLTNGTAYTFTVSATNFVGSGTGTTSNSVTPYACGSGVLTLSGGAPGNFAATLTGSDQSAYTSLATYRAADTDCGGWNITFQSSAFTCIAGTGKCPAGGDSLPSGSLLLAPPTVTCHAGTTCTGKSAPPDISIAGNTPIDTGSAVKVASAQSGRGLGTYDFTPGSIGVAGNNLQLTLPSYAYSTTYGSTITESIVSGP
jgi:hypothetical protein